jgi:hypothetical protein
VVADNQDLKDNDKLENKMINEVINYIEKIINYVNPNKGAYIAIDGVAPLAKIKQQRSRRFKSINDKQLFDNIKKKIFTPITCPNCHKPMTKGHLDKYMFSIHQKCSDCVFKYETVLKREGKYKEYEHEMIKKGVEYHIKEMENVLLELLMNNSEQFVTENGEIEEWKGKGHNNQFIQDIQEYIQKLKDTVNH